MTQLHELLSDRTIRECLDLADQVYARKQAAREERDRKIKELLRRKVERLTKERERQAAEYGHLRDQRRAS